MSRMTPEDYAEERESDNANTISRIEDLLIEIRDILKEMNKK